MNTNYIEFYFDCSSPWTYLAFAEILSLSSRQNLEIIWKPVLVGGVFNEVNQEVYSFRKKPNPLKLQYANNDLKLWAALRNINISFPKIFPVNSVRAMRGCFFAMKKNQLPMYAETIFRSYWEEGKDISSLDVLLDIANEVGFDRYKYEKFIQSRAAKDLLIQNTNELIERGGFGSPTFFYQNHMFFGNDRLALFEELFKKGYFKKKC